jgi:hypothetical protein
MKQREGSSLELERLRRRLAVVVDEGWAYRIRIAAIRAIQAMLGPNNPLKHTPPDALLDSVKPAWGARLEVVGGRAIERPVRRPPRSLNDVW